ncbi:ABC transporter permease [Sediminibacillus albus]|uniref:ABC-2 type transport system permease protein n=1 Tax=Sediminibacillus albus TaxID=407036 RepID=A0A1G8XDV2_9BACI|nr:ABC transporter permease [Sediminibacillus albus]SDJ88651.1 ABC-2 type transport system permease protein [Sediminibacillus albus]
MFDANLFFKSRFSSHMKEISRYLKYIFNGHIVVAMLFFISALAYYYQQWLAALPEGFPTALVISVLFGIIAAYSPARTLLKEADLVFLLPAETKMGSYFRSTLIYSFVVQLYLLALAAAALAPLYSAAYPERGGQSYLFLLLLLGILKIWHLAATWWILKVRDNNIRLVDFTARTLLTIAVFYLLINQALLLAALAMLLLAFVFAYDFYLAKKNPGIVWDVLVEKDNNRMRAFYRLANMFTDVPHLKNQIKKRHWLVSLLVKSVPFKQQRSFDYLFRITTVRSSDYIGIYTRLIIIGGLAAYFVPNLWMKIIFCLLFIYLTAFQLMSLWKHHRTIVWMDLYPVNLQWRRQALLKWLLQLLLAQTFLFGLLFIFMESLTGMVVVWAGGLAFSYLFVNGYVKKRLT